MQSVLQTCKPRPDLLSGSFNPEVFTASLRQVVGHYRGEIDVESAYTNAETFFGEATSPTHGMRQVVGHVMRRLAGDNMVPFSNRLETGFGGGKTHTLIACTHLAMRGSELAEQAAATGLVDPQHLPEPGSVSVVGIAGDELSVVRTRGDEVVPYTLWAELARQVGGDEMLEKVKAEAFAVGAPGESFFETVLGGRKVLVMIDELAQYAARAEAAHRGMGDQIAAFFMALFNYARNHSGIAIVVTLASSSDAFGGQTKRLAKLLQDASGKELTEADAKAIGEEALGGIQSVITRDAKVEKPVTSEEISSVLAKRLFVGVDPKAAEAAAAEYGAFYQKHKDQLPPRCSRAGGEGEAGGYAELVRKYYPFHPTLVDFLNKKLATAEDFQGTRGVLRVLAFAVKSIWQAGHDLGAIHTAHLDTSNPDLVNEILAKTDANELYNVLTADVGSVRGDGDTLHARSNAEEADAANPHPAKLPMQVYTWRTVFLHSLVGRQQGIGSSLFGLVQDEARLEVAQPGLPPSQVDTALEELAKRAFYLRRQDGKYFASLEPSVNKALAQIRDGISDDDLKDTLHRAARKVVTAPVPTFNVHHDVVAPQDLPDGKDKPMLGLAGLFADEIKPEDFVMLEKPGSPRKQQNLVFLLVPNTVAVASGSGDGGLYGQDQIDRNRRELMAIAKDVVAMRRLRKNPKNYSIEPRHLTDETEEGFPSRFAERENALLTRVTQAYQALWYPSATGQVVRKEISAAGGEGGGSVIQQIREVLTDDQELIEEDAINGGLLKEFRKLFFGDETARKLTKIRESFRDRRDWPILSEPGLLDVMVRRGVDQGLWCLYKLGEGDNPRPEAFHSRDTDAGGVPISVNLADAGWGLVTPEGATQRGWSAAAGVPYDTVMTWVRQTINETEADMTVGDLPAAVAAKHGDVDPKDVRKAVEELAKTGEVAAKPTTGPVKSGDSALMYVPDDTDTVLPINRAVEKGLAKAPDKLIQHRGVAGAKLIFPMLKRLSSLYTRGATSQVDALRIERLPLAGGGQVNMSFSGLTPAQLKQMGGLFDVLATQGKPDDDTTIDLTLMNPQEGCLLVSELAGGAS